MASTEHSLAEALAMTVHRFSCHMSGCDSTTYDLDEDDLADGQTLADTAREWYSGRLARPFTDEEMERLEYAAGHLAGARDHPGDPHAGDSADLAIEVLMEVFVGRFAEVHARQS